MRQEPKTSLGTLIIAGSSVCLWSCGDEHVEKPSSENRGESSSSIESNYGVKVYLGDSSMVATLGPTVPPANADPYAPAGASPPDSSGLREQIIIEADGVNVDLDEEGEIGDYNGRLSNSLQGEHLLAWAAGLECRNELIQNAPDFEIAQIVQRPWAEDNYAGDAWYHFANKGAGNPAESVPGGGFTSCDDVLAHQQLAQCMGEKLALVAEDAREPIVWEAPGTLGVSVKWDQPYHESNANYGYDGNALPFHATWVIPPQATRDKFVARDLAINALAHVAALDYEWVNFDVIGGSPDGCYAAYEELLIDSDDGVLDNDLVVYVFGTTGTTNYPPITALNATNVKPLVEARLREKTALFKASGLLLKDLIDKSLDADIAGANQRRSSAQDPKLGNERAWGLEGGMVQSHPDNTYNNLAHALNVLLGRLEVRDDEARDPAIDHDWLWADAPDHQALPAPVAECGNWYPRSQVLHTVVNGVSPGGTLDSPLPVGANGRWTSRPVTTAGQAYAVNQLRASGILLPNLNPGDLPMSAFREAVVEQLLLDASLDRELASADDLDEVEGVPFRETNPAKAIRASVEQISDGDMQFAVDRSAEWFQYLTQRGFGDNSHFNDNDPTESLNLKSNVAQELADIGGLALDGPVPWGDIAADAMSLVGSAQTNVQCLLHQDAPASTIPSLIGRNRAFQNTFVLGDTLKLRLNMVAGLAEEHGLAPEVENDARLASAGLRAWASVGRLVNGSFQSIIGPKTIDVRLQGFRAADFGFSTLDELASNVVLVYGRPWVADCAAGIRQSCPDNFDADYVQVPESVSVTDPSAVVPADETEIVLSQVGSFVPEFDPDFATGASREERLYVVVRKSAEDSAQGRILGALNLRGKHGANEYTVEVVSDYQREKINEILRIPEIDNEVGEQQPGEPPTCGDVQDDFVPLENELTSDGDGFETSWRHYLALAEQAAAKADEIGREIISRGLEQDYRREAAGRELAEICGEFGALDEFEFDAEVGSVRPAQSSEVLTNCFAEETKDVVFLTEDPWLGDTGADPTSVIHGWLGCGDSSIPRAALCDDNDITYGTLDLAPFLGEVELLESDCDEQAIANAQELAASQTINAAGLKALAFARPLVTANMGATLGSMRVLVQDDLEWSVTMVGTPVMSTTDNNLFPACVGGGTCNDVGSKFADLFGVTQAPANTTDKDALLQRVTSAMWQMARWVGYMPPGKINMPVPAADFEQLALAGIPEAPAVALYGAGQYFSQNGWHFDPSFGIARDFDRDVMGVGTSITAAYYDGVRNNPNRPPWMVDIYQEYSQYSSDEPYHHFRVSNAATVIPTPGLLDFVDEFAGRIAQSCAQAEHTPYIYDAPPICKGPNGEALLPNPAHIRDQAFTNAEVPLDWFTPTGGEVPVAGSIPGFSGNPGDGFFCDPYCNAVFEPELITHEATNVVVQLDTSCDHAHESPYVRITPDCASYASDSTSNTFSNWPDPVNVDWIRFTESALLPSSCAPAERVGVYSGLFPKLDGDDCEPAQRVVDAMGMACLLGGSFQGLPPGQPLPPILQPADLFKLKDWLFQQGLNSRRAISLILLRSVPQRVIDDFKTGRVASGDIEGKVGDLFVQYENGVRAIATGWNSLAGDFDQLGVAIDNAQLALTAVELASDSQLTRIAMEQMEQHARVAKGIVQAAASAASVGGGVFLGNPIQAAADAVQATIDVETAQAQLTHLTDLETLANKQEANDVAAVLGTLQEKTIPLYDNMQATIDSIRSAAGDALRIGAQLNGARREAQYVAAQGTGADFYRDENNEPVLLPVNTVLNRQYDIARYRYDRALEQAKRLAQYAKFAIEARIGRRLSTMTEPIGLFDAPASWEGELCEMQGIDYAALRDAGDEVPVEGLASDEFVSPFVGDYIDKLRNFMEHYNVEYPSHESDDVAVLSVRDDLITAGGRCFAEVKNELLFSGSLGTAFSSTSGDGRTVQGWQTTHCSTDNPTCLATEGGQTLYINAAKDFLRPPEGVGGVSWLHDEPPSAGAVESVVEDGTPARTVYQTVDLLSGVPYVLSWWDMARASHADEEAAHDEAATFDPEAVGVLSDYNVVVYDESWNIVAADVVRPHHEVVDGSLTWGPRRVIQFTPDETAPYHVSFTASIPGTTGSIAIGNVQLEQAFASGEPTGYVHTEHSTRQLRGDCSEGSPEDFRTQFEYKCEASGNACWWELIPNLIIDTYALDRGESPLEGKLARGNFNYRHLSTALNVVGTGVLDCSLLGTSDCYGSGYLEYTLEHVAYDVPIIDHAGRSHQSFNFGEARIERGKALATERYLTLPLGSADHELLAQPQTTKIEFYGRPLTGAYRLRIFDKPALSWKNLEDVQLVLTYRYWSRVQSD